MSPYLASMLSGVALLLSVLPSQAQYAFTQVASPQREGSISIDPEDGTKAPAFKVVHGVVQGKLGALPGATVWLHGTRTIVVTNAEGEFELRVPADAKVVELTCGYGGLQEEMVRLAPVSALGSVYLLRDKTLTNSKK